MEEEEIYPEQKVNNITTDKFFQTPVTTNAQKKGANVKNERQLIFDIHEETIK